MDQKRGLLDKMTRIVLEITTAKAFKALEAILDTILDRPGYVSGNLDCNIDSTHVASGKYFELLTMQRHKLFGHNKNKQMSRSLI